METEIDKICSILAEISTSESTQGSSLKPDAYIITDALCNVYCQLMRKQYNPKPVECQNLNSPENTNQMGSSNCARIAEAKKMIELNNLSIALYSIVGHLKLLEKLDEQDSYIRYLHRVIVPIKKIAAIGIDGIGNNEENRGTLIKELEDTKKQLIVEIPALINLNSANGGSSDLPEPFNSFEVDFSVFEDPDSNLYRPKATLLAINGNQASLIFQSPHAFTVSEYIVKYRKMEKQNFEWISIKFKSRGRILEIFTIVNLEEGQYIIKYGAIPAIKGTLETISTLTTSNSFNKLQLKYRPLGEKITIKTNISNNSKAQEDQTLCKRKETNRSGAEVEIDIPPLPANSELFLDSEYESKSEAKEKTFIPPVKIDIHSGIMSRLSSAMHPASTPRAIACKATIPIRVILFLTINESIKETFLNNILTYLLQVRKEDYFRFVISQPNIDVQLQPETRPETSSNTPASFLFPSLNENKSSQMPTLYLFPLWPESPIYFPLAIISLPVVYKVDKLKISLKKMANLIKEETKAVNGIQFQSIAIGLSKGDQGQVKTIEKVRDDLISLFGEKVLESSAIFGICDSNGKSGDLIRTSPIPESTKSAERTIARYQLAESSKNSTFWQDNQNSIKSYLEQVKNAVPFNFLS